MMYRKPLVDSLGEGALFHCMVIGPHDVPPDSNQTFTCTLPMPLYGDHVGVYHNGRRVENGVDDVMLSIDGTHVCYLDPRQPLQVGDDFLFMHDRRIYERIVESGIGHVKAVEEASAHHAWTYEMVKLLAFEADRQLDQAFLQIDMLTNHLNQLIYAFNSHGHNSGNPDQQMYNV